MATSIENPTGFSRGSVKPNEIQNMGDYLNSKNREEFVAICMTKGMKKNTAKRRYYKIRKFVNHKVLYNYERMAFPKKEDTQKLKPKIESDEFGLIVLPDNFKLIQLTDMKRYKKKITEEYLQKNGFAQSDIAWIKFMGII